MKQPGDLQRSKASQVKVGDLVRRSHRGAQTGVVWEVIEVRPKKLLHPWGFSFRELRVRSTTSTRLNFLDTWEVDVIGQVKKP